MIEESVVVAKFSYEHNDGDQIWDDITTFYQMNDGTFQKEYYEGYYGKTKTSLVTFEEIVERMNQVEKEVELEKQVIELHGSGSVLARGGYSIVVPLKIKNDGQHGIDIKNLPFGTKITLYCNDGHKFKAIKFGNKIGFENGCFIEISDIENKKVEFGW